MPTPLLSSAWLAVLLSCAASRAPTFAPPAPAPAPVSAAAAPAPGLGPAAGAESCQVDADCVVTNFASCCACPQCAVGQPRARSKASLDREMQSCRVAECDLRPCGLGGMCPPGEDASHFTAKCVAGTCSSIHR